MSDLQEPTPNISSLSVLYPEGNFPSHIDIFGKGGFIALNDAIGGSGYNEFINERVTLERRKPGMLVYINSDNTYHKCATAGSSESTGEWDRQYFSGRYFYGASAPTASDVVIGEKWFNTDVGSEFTYLPIDENQNTFFWVDIDHLGQGKDAETVNIVGNSPINVVEQNNEYTISLTDNFVNTSGDTMNGTLTGTDASFDSITATNGFIGTLTGNIADFGHITADTGFIGTLTGNIADFGHITADTGFIGGSLTADRAFRNSDNGGFENNEFITKNYYETNGFYVKKSGDTMSGDLFVNRGFRTNGNPANFNDTEFITKLYAEDNFGSGDIEINNGTNDSGNNEFSPYNWELTKIVLSRTDDGGTLLKSIYRIEPQIPSSGNLAGNNITLNFSYLCGNSTYDLLDIVLDVTINNTLESYGGIYYSAHSIHTNNIGKQFVNNNGAIKISYANSGPGPAWFNNTIYLSCLFKI